MRRIRSSTSGMASAPLMAASDPGRDRGPGSGALAALGEPLLVIRLVDALVDVRLGQEERHPALADRLLGDDALANLGPLRDVVHHFEERLLDDRAKRPGPGLAIERDLCGRPEC